MDFTKFYILFILFLAYLFGNLIINFSKDEIKNSTKFLLFVRFVLHILILGTLLYLIIPFTLYKIVFILLGILISYFYFNPLILTISIFSLNLSERISLFLISLILIYNLMNGIIQLKLIKKNIYINSLLLILIFVIAIFFLTNDNKLTSLALAFSFGYLINIKILKYKSKNFINT